MSDVRDYQGRTVDVMAFQNVQYPGDVELTHALALPGAGGTIATGLQKLAQRFLLELLTEQGSVRYNSSAGSSFMVEARLGYFRTATDVHAAVSRAVMDIKRHLETIATAKDPLDEQLDFVEITQIQFSPGRATVYLELHSQDPDARIILPINVAI